MTREESGTGTRPGSFEFHDRRRRAKQRLMTAPHVTEEILDDSQHHGKAHQVQFKVSPLVAEVGEKVAKLYGLSLSQFSKALLYQNLAIYEPTDRRRKKK